MLASSDHRAIRFWLIRHAPILDTRSGFPDAQGKPDLSDTAILNRLVAALPTDAVWMASPWPRTRQTGETLSILSGKSTAALVLEERFTEQNFGLWAGMSHDQAAQNDPDLYQRFWNNPAQTTPPGGESFADQIKRVKDALHDLIEQHTAKPKIIHQKKRIPIQDGANTPDIQAPQPITDIIIITHAGTIRAALATALGCSEQSALHFHLDCLSLTRLDYWAVEGSSTGWTVNHVNHHPAGRSQSAHPTPKPMTTLVLGGIRSGKSAHAEELTLHATAKDQTPIYIATADPALSATDQEMGRRIEEHRRRRGNRWHLIEEPDHLSACIAALTDNQTVTNNQTTSRQAPILQAPVLIDSISLWLANRISKNAPIDAEIDQLCQVLTQVRRPVIVVADEVGLGGVPGHPTARAFADQAGGLNARLAALCDQVILVSAGLATFLKP